MKEDRVWHSLKEDLVLIQTSEGDIIKIFILLGDGDNEEKSLKHKEYSILPTTLIVLLSTTLIVVRLEITYLSS